DGGHGLAHRSLGSAAAGRRSGVGEGGSLRKQLLRGKSQAVDQREYLGPLLTQEALALASQQEEPRALAHEHAASAALFYQPFVDQLPVSLEHRQRVEPIVGGD